MEVHDEACLEILLPPLYEPGSGTERWIAEPATAAKGGTVILLTCGLKATIREKKIDYLSKVSQFSNVPGKGYAHEDRDQ
jgi:hypothetical protein